MGQLDRAESRLPLQRRSSCTALRSAPFPPLPLLPSPSSCSPPPHAFHCAASLSPLHAVSQARLPPPVRPTLQADVRLKRTSRLDSIVAAISTKDEPRTMYEASSDVIWCCRRVGGVSALHTCRGFGKLLRVDKGSIRPAVSEQGSLINPP
ncbi:hypothetical protein BCR35DRAFT_43315 [Leucosporidium creatinivorum]|uniref:Uncharacterized protein n=1 Tax=Leucosporidium creatinivorum TaxID=106004 RepID=A0A1Y2C1J6_9BASI|nr:hypothetical protein BCR35DRAFT_43315 [Leucosporidium creatinivorum]